ncbi:MAG: hypothetical protein GY719_05905 [bacterium]|nr:hypothetical protein [bacterium]
MKILWAEDGGGNLAISDAILGLFGEIVPTEPFKDDYEPEQKVEIELRKYFARHSAHEITVCRGYDDFAFLEANNGVDFDVAILDINLNEYPTNEPPIPAEDFDNRAGLFIYNELIRTHRFSDENIAFFTGETGTLNTFIEATTSGMLRAPMHCFEKKKVDYKRISAWLKERADSPYLTLRRGILDSANFAKEILEEVDEPDLPETFPLFAPADPSRITDYNAYRTRLDRYLYRIETQLPMERPDHLSGVLTDFLANLTNPWGTGVEGVPNAIWENPTDVTAEGIFRRSAPTLLKLLHDWASMDLLGSGVTEDFVAFATLISFRSLFRWPSGKPLPHEQHLLSLVGQEDQDSMASWLTEDLKALLEHSYEEIAAVVESDPRRAAHYLSLCENFGNRTISHSPDVRQEAFDDMENHSLELVRRGFWHGLAPVWSDPYLDSVYLSFRVAELPPEEFLHELAQRLAPSSFSSILKQTAA